MYQAVKKAFINSNSKLMISEYAAKLDGNIKSRYLEKIAVIGIDPLLIPKQKFDPECLPPVEANDLLSYLVLDTSFYTNAQFKAFRSLQAYNQMVSGFISSNLGHIIKKKYVVVAKVTTFVTDERSSCPVMDYHKQRRDSSVSTLYWLYGWPW